jgi:type II secretory pathway pseudopilin PulG
VSNSTVVGRRTRPAFTLVEMLAVTCLIALAAAVLVAALSRPSPVASRSDLVASISRVDRAARLAALQGVRVELVAARGRLIARQRDNHAHVAAAALPDEMVLTRFGDNRPAQIRFDARGRTENYTVRPGSHSTGVMYTVAGASGWVSRAESGETR